MMRSICDIRGCVRKVEIANKCSFCFKRYIIKYPDPSVQSSHYHGRLAKGIVAETVRSYKAGSKKRGIKWELSSDQVKNLIFRPCHYCGNDRDKVHLGVFYCGIDRFFDNSGYIEGNVVPCCRICNQAKMALPIDEWYAWINRISVYNARIRPPNT